MTFRFEMSRELERIHANHQLRLITSKIADELDESNDRIKKLEERIDSLERK